MKTTRQKTQEIEAQLAKQEAWLNGQEQTLQNSLVQDARNTAAIAAPGVREIAGTIAASHQADADFKTFEAGYWAGR